MGMFSRMSDIIQANINAILDKAEDPHKVIRLIIQEMQESLVELRTVAASSLAEKKALCRKQSKLQQDVLDWQRKAQLAMEKDREDLARAALVEKHQAQEALMSLQSELDTVDEAIEKLQDDSGRLQEKLNEARSRQKSLQVRKTSAQTRLKVKAQQHVFKIDDAIARFETYEQRIDDMEAQVEAHDLTKGKGALAQEFMQMETNDAIEKELAALRQQAA